MSKNDINPPPFTNRLLHETSPYLMQHAHNPVDWYPWGPEALERAHTENKPILLSIGYSACHWCHVMAHESFEDPATAELMNQNFVNIKVDREERPDLDGIYMEAVQAMTGRGGWPMTVFLTPDGAPFYAGTYFPPDDRYAPQMPGFPAILLALAEAWEQRPADIAHNATQIKQILENNLKLANQSSDLLDEDLLKTAWATLADQFDFKRGGLNGAPKFPQPMLLDFALRCYRRFHDPIALQVVELTLHKMANGGMYDQLGGGFHRYSTDAVWLVPHFEKMLYDNAQLSQTYLNAFLLTGNAFYEQIAVETLDYVVREMLSPTGGFYSTQDADSEGEEGKFFVWSRAEIEAALGSDAPAFIKYYGVTDKGNFEHKNILNVPRPLETVAVELNMTGADLQEILSRGRTILYKLREQRIKPGRDEKMLTAWNGMMLKSFAIAARVLKRPDYLEIALGNANFILQNLEREGKLLRTFKEGQEAKLNGYLEDYSYLVDGLLALYEATFDLNWLQHARRLTDTMLGRYWDDENSCFYDTATDHETLVVRPRSYFDNAVPSGQSVAADVLLRLALLTGDTQDYQPKAAAVLRQFAALAVEHPSGFGRLLGVLDFWLGAPKEVVIVGQSDAADVQALLEVVYGAYLPNKVVMLRDTSVSAEQEAQYPLLQDRTQIEGKATAYVCENYTCQRPVTTVEELEQQLELNTIPFK